MSSNRLAAAIFYSLIFTLVVYSGSDASLDQKPRAPKLSASPDPASVAVCDALKAKISQRSVDALRRDKKPSNRMMPPIENLKGVEPTVQALINIEERLYGIWRVVGDTGLCQDSMAVLADSKTANEVAHFVRSHELAESNEDFYDDEFKVLAKNYTEWRYVDNLSGVW